MRCRNVTFLAVMLILAAPGPGLAQQRPATRPTDFIIAELAFEKVPFDKVMEYLRETVPGFQVQVLREVHVPADYPKITLRAKDITPGQVLAFLRSAYDVNWEQIDGPKGPIYMVRLSHSNMLNSQLQADQAAQREANAPRQHKYVRVYPLSGLAPNAKDPLADVLSLVQAAIEQSGVPQPALKLHEPTRALLATGDEQALAVIDNVLGALKPAQDDVRRQYEAKLQEAEQAMRLRQVEFEGKLRMMEVQRAQLEQAMQGQQQALQQAARAEQEELRSLVRKLEVELSATRARGAQPVRTVKFAR